MQYLVICAESGATIETHEELALAIDRAQQLQSETGKKHYSKKAPDLRWRERERDRFWSGTYQHVAWHNEPWFYDADTELKAHFLHRSSDKPEFVAFTESAEKGEQDRQTRMRAGAYLEKYFSDSLTSVDIAQWARIHAMQGEKLSLDDVKIARSVDEIRDVYLHGPASCMSENSDHYHCHPHHPVDVYGDSDLGVAYVERSAEFHSAKISARALIWPEKKIFGRVYPTAERYSGMHRQLASSEAFALIQALEAMGYSKGSFCGAQIRAIRISSRDSDYVMPYLDGSYRVDLSSDEKHFTITKGREGVDAQNTNGTIDIHGGIFCERCDESTDEDYAQTVYTSRDSTEMWCECCANNRAFYCHGSEEIYSDNIESVEMNGETYSIHYATRNFTQCERTDEWIDPEDATTVHVKSGTETWSTDALDDAFCCELSSEYYSADDFESVEIDGSTYERSAAMDDLILSAKIAEMESETVETE